MAAIQSERKYCVTNRNEFVVRDRVTMRQAVAFCLRYKSRGYDICVQTERGVRMISWVFDLSKY